MNTLHKRLFVMLFLVNAGTSPVWADNAIYIDQVGSGVDIDITQDGSGNKIGANDTDNTKMLIDGDDYNVMRVRLKLFGLLWVAQVRKSA